MFPMRSLDKGVNDEDITHFVTQSTFGGKRYLAQPKLDGSASLLSTSQETSTERQLEEVVSVAKMLHLTLNRLLIFHQD